MRPLCRLNPVTRTLPQPARPPTTSWKPTAKSSQPSTSYHQRASNQQPPTNNEQRATNNYQPATNNQQRATPHHQRLTTDHGLRTNHAFTLLELLVVISVIVTLTGTMAWGRERNGVPGSSLLEFTVSGIIVTHLEGQGTTNQPTTNQFTCEVKGTLYAIQVLCPGNENLVGLEAVYDGTNTFCFYDYNTNRPSREVFRDINGVMTRVPLERPVPVKNQACLFVKAGPSPPSNFWDPVQAIWLAYAAGVCFTQTTAVFAASQALVPLPPFLLQATARTVINRSPGNPLFVGRAVEQYWASGRSTRKGPLPWGEVHGLKADAAGRKRQGPFVSADYQVIEWAKKPIVMPSAFQLRRYGWRMTTTPDYHHVDLAYATNILTKTTNSFQPRLRSRTLVTEMRPEVVGDMGWFTYFSRSGLLLTRSELLKDATFRARMGATSAAGDGDVLRGLFYVFFAVLLGLPVVYVLTRRRLAKQE